MGKQALVESGGEIAPMASESLGVIERAARDPNVDPEKLERLMALHERVSARDAKAAYTRALAALQQELPAIVERGGIKNKGGETQSTYALWEDINATIKPLLQKHGFALSFRIGQNAEKVTVTGVLSHVEGHSEDTTMFLPVDTSGSKNAVQAVGSSISYGKRYTATALLNLTSRGDDDDGKAAGGDGPISDDQFATLEELIERSGADIEGFTKYMKVPAIREIRAKDFGRAVEALNTKLRKAGGK